MSSTPWWLRKRSINEVERNNSGDCELCGHWSSDLVHRECRECRNRYHVDCVDHDVGKGNPANPRCEIIAVKIGSVITNDMAYIKAHVWGGGNVRLLSRRQMELMAACDFGENWKKLASSETLFIQNEDGTYSPNGVNA